MQKYPSWYCIYNWKSAKSCVLVMVTLHSGSYLQIAVELLEGRATRWPVPIMLGFVACIHTAPSSFLLSVPYFSRPFTATACQGTITKWVITITRKNAKPWTQMTLQAINSNLPEVLLFPPRNLLNCVNRWIRFIRFIGWLFLRLPLFWPSHLAVSDLSLPWDLKSIMR